MKNENRKEQLRQLHLITSSILLDMRIDSINNKTLGEEHDLYVYLRKLEVEMNKFLGRAKIEDSCKNRLETLNLK